MFFKLLFFQIHILNGIDVLSLGGNNLIELPAVFTQSSIPVSQENIPTEMDIRERPYLNDVHWNFFGAEKPLLQKDRQNNSSTEWWKIVVYSSFIYHKRKMTIRVVFDYTSSVSGPSLNSELLEGPDITNSFLDVLLRFWQEPVAMMGDIEGMFHQVRIPEEDEDFVRLWRSTEA